MVRLIDDDHVPVDLLHLSRPLIARDPSVGHDDIVVSRKRVARVPLGLSEVADGIRIEDSECLVELRLEFELPLPSQIRRDDNQATLHDSSCPEFLEDHSSLDRLPKTNLIAKQIAMWVVGDHAVNYADLVRFHINPGVPERHKIVVEMREVVVARD